MPKDDPIHNVPTDKKLQDAIYLKINKSIIIIIPTGMYAVYSKWIQKEIDGAEKYKKPILAVNLWGQERKASVVIKAANKTVSWNKNFVVKGIWHLYGKSKCQ